MFGKLLKKLSNILEIQIALAIFDLVTVKTFNQNTDFSEFFINLKVRKKTQKSDLQKNEKFYSTSRSI